MRRGSASSTSNSNSPGPAKNLAAVRHPACRGGDQAADGVDVLGVGERGEIEADRLGDVVERRARLDEEAAVARAATIPASRPRRARPRCRRRSTSTMSSIETRPSVPPYSSMTSAIWVRDACILHQEIKRRHRGRREQNRPQDPRRRQRRVDARSAASRACRASASPVDEAEARIGGEEDRRNRGCGSCRAGRRAFRRRPAGANGRRCGNRRRTSLSGGIERQRDDVGARHHHVVDAHVVQREHVLEDRALLRREIGVASRSPRAHPRCRRAPSRRRGRTAPRSRSNSPEGCSREPFAGGVSGARSPSFVSFIRQRLRARRGRRRRAAPDACASSASMPPPLRPSRDRSRGDAESHGRRDGESGRRAACPRLVRLARQRLKATASRRAGGLSRGGRPRGGEGEHVGRLVDAAPARVQRAMRASSARWSADLRASRAARRRISATAAAIASRAKRARSRQRAPQPTDR